MIERRLVVVVAALTVSSCGDASRAATALPLPDPSCEGRYGAPNENTGLSLDDCFARIEGNETWGPRVWDAAALADLRSWTLENPPVVLMEDPYLTTPDLQPDEEAVCAVMVTGLKEYRLKTFTSSSEAELAGGVVTHGFACGLCSSLEDLAAYAETTDQTGPVRQCALENQGRVEELDACIQDAVGFTPPCARIWAYNALNDSRECLSICVAELDSSYNQEDGSLNPCLQCDEDNSGPVFKTMAGRTRRGSGLAAAICRPCNQVWRVDHEYD